MAEVETKKSATEYTEVTLTDGHKVSFPGKRKVAKETLIDESKIAVDGDTLTLSSGAVSIRMDFRNGETRTIALPDASRECFGKKLDTLIACLPPSPFRETLIDEIGELRQASRKQALEEVANEFDKRAKPVTGYYEPEEPAEIIRSLK